VIVVADASVALKWFFRTRADEPDVAAALALLNGVADASVALLEPPHFVAEVCAVLVREAPSIAARNLSDLCAIEMRIDADAAVYERAMALAARHKQHLFDTLYHALALVTPGALFVTADDAYWRKARVEGAIARLAEFRLGA
jgi:predicted nucleic acid-binding protein